MLFSTVMPRGHVFGLTQAAFECFQRFLTEDAENEIYQKLREKLAHIFSIGFAWQPGAPPTLPHSNKPGEPNCEQLEAGHCELDC